MIHRPNPLNPHWRRPGDPLYMRHGTAHDRPMAQILDDHGSDGAARWPSPYPGHRLGAWDDIENLEPPGGGS